MTDGSMATENLPSSNREPEPLPTPPKGVGTLIKGLLPLVLFLAFAAAWKWTPLKDQCELDNIACLAMQLRESSFVIPVVIGAYVLGGLVMFPVMVLVLATILTFDPFTAFVYSFAGCMASAVALFGVGYGLGRDTVRRLMGARFDKLSCRLGRQGLLMVVTIRLFPIAPYTIVNFIAGAADIRFRDYVLGTVLGLAPWLALICILAKQLVEAVRHPNPQNTLLFGLLVLCVYLANYMVNRWLSKRDLRTECSPEGQSSAPSKP